MTWTPELELERAVRDHATELVSYALRAGLDADSARDAVQAALLDAWHGLLNRSRPNNLRAWIYRLVHNRIVSQRRHDGALRKALLRCQTPEPTEPPADLELLEALRGLPDRQRQILLLRYCQGLEHGEVAEVLDLPESTVKVYASRALADLRERLAISRNAS